MIHRNIEWEDSKELFKIFLIARKDELTMQNPRPGQLEDAYRTISYRVSIAEEG